MSEINETLKKKIDDLDLDRRLNGLVDQAESLFKRAVDSAADYASEHRDDVDRVLDRVSSQIDERTEGKYADKVGKVREQLEVRLTKLADRRPDREA